MELPLMRSFFLLLLLLCSCQPQPRQIQEENIGDLPSPPFSELTNRSLLDPAAISINTSSIKEGVVSLQKVVSAPHLQRAHLEEVCYQLFQKLATSDDLDTTIMTLFATTAANHPLSRSIIKELLHSPSPLIQLVAVQSLSQTNDADSLLVEALRSNFIGIRLEAAWQLAKKRSKDSFFHIDALYSKLSKEFHPYMAELFAQEGSSGSIHRLRNMLYDTDEAIVISSLLAIGRHNISDLNNDVVSLTLHSPQTLEALAYALQCNESCAARERLHELSNHYDSHVQVQALLSRIFLGELSFIETLLQQAQQGDPFALSALSSCPALPHTPYSPTSRTERINHAITLLKHKECASLPYLKEIFSLADDEILFSRVSSAGTQQYVEPSTLYSFPADTRSMIYEHSLVVLEELLSQTIELEESAFLEITQYLFQQGRIELYPTLLSLLKNKRSDATIELLKKEASRVGAPYNRVSASLGLIQLGIFSERDLKEVLDFTRAKKEQPWRHPLPHMFTTQYLDQRHQTTTSAQLYVEALEMLAQSGSQEAISMLQEELEHVPMHFLPFVVGALLHATL